MRPERAARAAGRTVARLFYESSTRTRTSFELAAKSLGATDHAGQRQVFVDREGESLRDTGLTAARSGRGGDHSAASIVGRGVSAGAG